MKTEVLGTGSAEEFAGAREAAVLLLRKGEVVALPTETVYGLAADALSADAALKIFEAKERPRFDPLIVHLPDPDALSDIGSVASADGKLVDALISRFWPGPLTLVLPRKAVVPDVVTAGLETVAMRVSAHAVFSGIVRAFGGPLAAPSANRFGRISPTCAEHVRAELDDRIPLIVDAGPTEHGLESTIVAVRGRTIQVLRPGPITNEQLREFGEVCAVGKSARVEAPGQLPSHYAPRTPLVLTDNLKTFRDAEAKRVGALSLRGAKGAGFAEQRALSREGNLHEAAANLFRSLRELDDAGLDLIVAEKLPGSGLGYAINDRLRRASAANSGGPDRLG